MESRTYKILTIIFLILGLIFIASGFVLNEYTHDLYNLKEYRDIAFSLPLMAGSIGLVFILSSFITTIKSAEQLPRWFHIALIAGIVSILLILYFTIKIAIQSAGITVQY